MNIGQKLEEVRTKEEFIRFMALLKKDKLKHANEWENTDIPSYLEAVASWAEDMDGYY